MIWILVFGKAWAFEDLEEAIETSIIDPYYSMTALKHWIKKGEFAMAEEFANRILGIWVSEDDENINKDLIWKLKLAAKINSEFYYQKLKDKDCTNKESIKNEGTGIQIIRNYSKVFTTNALKYTKNYFSITDYLANKIYIDPDLSEQDGSNKSKQEIQKAIEISIYELSKKSDITFSILHAIALQAKEDPYFRIHIFAIDLTDGGNLGSYSELLDRVHIVCNTLRTRGVFEGRLIHEWTHQLMNILYDNKSKPYRRENRRARSEYLKVIEGIRKIENEGGIRGIEKFKEVFARYNKGQHESECVARLAEVIALGYYEEVEVREALKPLYDYWMKYVAPDIERYVRDRVGVDDFICDWERENVLGVLYGDG